MPSARSCRCGWARRPAVRPTASRGVAGGLPVPAVMRRNPAELFRSRPGVTSVTSAGFPEERSLTVPRLLLLVSAAREITLADGTQHETGFFAEEALIPYDRFARAGLDIVVATPGGP